jgi:hypothetical protein
MLWQLQLFLSTRAKPANQLALLEREILFVLAPFFSIHTPK